MWLGRQSLFKNSELVQPANLLLIIQWKMPLCVKHILMTDKNCFRAYGNHVYIRSGKKRGIYKSRGWFETQKHIFNLNVESVSILGSRQHCGPEMCCQMFVCRKKTKSTDFNLCSICLKIGLMPMLFVLVRFHHQFSGTTLDFLFLEILD